MDPLISSDLLSLGSHLHRLARRSTDGLETVAQELGLAAEPRWFGALRLLQVRGPIGITELARSLGLSHPAVVQVAGALDLQGLIRDRRDARDERRRLLTLSARGRDLVEGLESLWQAQEAATRRWMDEAGVDLPAVLASLEDLLDREPMDERIRRELRRMDYESVSVRPMAPGEEPVFADLNRAWIEESFEMEEPDRQVLFHPRETILKAGGRIYMARLDGQIVGTCALLKVNDRQFELAKMAVDPEWRGRQVGARLCDHVIDEARKLGAHTLLLQTNRLLETAVRLYLSRGWVVDETAAPTEHYHRADLTMRLDLEARNDRRTIP
jgi:GNAT superfamily N-acetyltransferase